MATKLPRGRARRADAPGKLPSTSDPIEIAMIAAAAGKPLPDAARNVLEKHAKLIDAQCSELKLRRVGEGVRAALWAILAIVALAIVALIAAVVVRASRSDALVVQSFRVPPAMAEQGLTGEVLATQVLDKLAEMQARSESTRAASSYANNWGDELKIDIPQTGASVDQVWKLIRDWLGKETRISGEVIRTNEALTLTARVGSAAGQRFTSATGELDNLVVQAAELIYRETQPYRYGIYVGREPDRRRERFSLLQQLTGDPSERERKWAYNGLAVDYREQGNLRMSLKMVEQALALDSKMIPAWGNRATAYFELGHEQRSVDVTRSQYELPVTPEYDTRVVKANNCQTRGRIGTITRSASDLRSSIECYTQVGGSFVGTTAFSESALALLTYDLPAARAVKFAPTRGYSAANAEFDLADVALRASLFEGALAEIERALDRHIAALAANITAPEGGEYRSLARSSYWPLQAEALARLGRRQEAAALIAKTPLDSYSAVRARGLLAQAMGNAPAAQRWFTKALGQGPRLAPAYVDLGRLLAQHRRFESAVIHFKEAVELAPDWADPIKYWGDALASQGRRKEALIKYEAALRLAPKWVELRQARSKLLG